MYSDTGYNNYLCPTAHEYFSVVVRTLYNLASGVFCHCASLSHFCEVINYISVKLCMKQLTIIPAHKETSKVVKFYKMLLIIYGPAFCVRM